MATAYAFPRSMRSETVAVSPLGRISCLSTWVAVSVRLLQEGSGLPTPPAPGSNASFYPASCRPGPLPGPPGTTVSLGSEWGLVCCQPGQHLLPTPSPVTGAGRGGGLQNDRWNFCSQATPHPLGMPFPSGPGSRKASPPLPSVNLISWMMCLSCLWG